jgi:UPF0755 protein
MLRVINRLFFVALVLIAAAGGYLAYQLQIPYAGFKNEVFVDIPSGTSTRGMARMLESAGVIRNQWQFLVARALRRGQVLQAGEYRFAQPASVWTVIQRIIRGDIFFYELTIPEGSNQFDVAAAVENLGVMKAQDFLKVAADSELIKDLDPAAPSLEGYLFPATYRLTRHTEPRQFARDMIARFRRAWKELAHPEADPHYTVTLASLIEKEAAVPADRPAIASVFANRLDRGMTLDCDPSTIYAAILEKRYRGTIHRSDLQSLNEYNTYKHAGLPPGPIANPGLDSLKAALSPAQTDYFYFVAKPDGSGSHQFSTSLEEHNKAVQAYRDGHKR